VEEALLTHPEIADVAVIGLPDARVGERACAVVVPQGVTRISLEEMRDHLVNERKIAIWKVPERIEFVSELPLTATGKIQKFVLRERLGRRGLTQQAPGDGRARPGSKSGR
jgi:cyclohexanecarboxylate-CoA ligase/acyl-CoA synthetase